MPKYRRRYMRTSHVYDLKNVIPKRIRSKYTKPTNLSNTAEDIARIIRIIKERNGIIGNKRTTPSGFVTYCITMLCPDGATEDVLCRATEDEWKIIMLQVDVKEGEEVVMIEDLHERLMTSEMYAKKKMSLPKDERANFELFCGEVRVRKLIYES